MNRKQIKYLLAAFLLVTPSVAKANLIWPSIYIVQQYYTWYVIVAGLIAETVAARFCLKTNWKKAFLVMLAVNAISALVGTLLIPVSGIVVEILMAPINSKTFSLSHWILDYLFVVLSNTCVEGLSLKQLFKYPFKPNFWWLLGANAVSVIVCVLSQFL